MYKPGTGSAIGAALENENAALTVVAMAEEVPVPVGVLPDVGVLDLDERLEAAVLRPRRVVQVELRHGLPVARVGGLIMKPPKMAQHGGQNVKSAARPRPVQSVLSRSNVKPARGRPVERVLSRREHERTRASLAQKEHDAS